MTTLDELARAARSELSRSADRRASARPTLDTLRQRGAIRHATAVVGALALVVVAVVAVGQLIGIGPSEAPVIGEVDLTPDEPGEPAEDAGWTQPEAATEAEALVSVEVEGRPPLSLWVWGATDGSTCRAIASAPAPSLYERGSCSDPSADPATLFGSIVRETSQIGSSASGCEHGVVDATVATVELRYPDGYVENLDAVSASSEVGGTYYATCWDGHRGEPTRVPLDEQGDELARLEQGRR